MKCWFVIKHLFIKFLMKFGKLKFDVLKQFSVPIIKPKFIFKRNDYNLGPLNYLAVVLWIFNILSTMQQGGRSICFNKWSRKLNYNKMNSAQISQYKFSNGALFIRALKSKYWSSANICTNKHSDFGTFTGGKNIHHSHKKHEHTILMVREKFFSSLFHIFNVFFHCLTEVYL